MRCFLFLLLQVVAAFCTAQNHSFFPGELTRRLDSVAMQDVPACAPGIATAIIRNGKVVYQRCAGYANLEDSILITPDSRFNIASNGKQFTALAILLLADAGKLQLEDPIQRYFPTLLPKHRISISQLLHHRSGIRDVYDLWALQGLTWWKQTFNNNDALQLLLQQQDLNFVPGSQYLYSNSNYILLALLIEKVSGQSFVSFTSGMFRKLGMPNTSFEANDANIKGGTAKAYFNFNTWTHYKWIWNVCGDGNLFSTLKDQAHWEQVLQGAKTNVPRKLLLQSQQFPDGSYGYGLETAKYKGTCSVFHEGATGAWKATVFCIPDKNMAVVTLVNTGKAIPSQQTRQMVDIVLQLPREEFKIRPDTQGGFITDDETAGLYLTSTDFYFRFEKESGILYLKREGRNPVVITRASANVFHQKNDTAFQQEFTRDEQGNLQVTAYYPTHAPYTLKKIQVNTEPFDPLAFEGTYLNSETQTNIKLRYTGTNQYEISIGTRNPCAATLIHPSKLLVHNYSIRIEKEDNGIALYLNGERIKQVRFDRR